MLLENFGSNPSPRITETAPKKFSIVQINDKKIIRAWSIMLVGLLVTAWASFSIKEDVELIAKKDFVFASEGVKEKIQTRLHAHAQLLRSAAAYVESNVGLKRTAWGTFVANQKIEKNLPGILGIGYSVVIPPAELARHEAIIRKEGFSRYSVRPAGKRDIYTSIIFLEPFSGRNLRAFGYDMFSEPIRRKAMEQARDFDEATLSGKIMLVQETDKDVQAGTLMYVPVYDKGLPVGTIKDRRAALRGWVYSPSRMNDLMMGILGGWEPDEGKQIRLEVFADTSYESGALLYDSKQGMQSGPISASASLIQTSIVFNGRQWSLRFTQAKGFTSGTGYSKVWIVAIGGTLLSALLFTLYILLINTKFRAQGMAEELTRELRESEEKFSRVFANAPAILSLSDLETGRFTEVNEEGMRVSGFSREELIGKISAEIGWIGPEDRARLVAILKEHGRVSGIELALHAKGGRTVWCLYHGEVVTIAGKPQLLSISQDITERKLAEENLRRMEERLRQSEKMDAIGQLAGGIAHDFNNVLGGIIGFTDLSLNHAEKGSLLEKYLLSVLKAADRAKNLVMQILAFSRQSNPQKKFTLIRPIIEEVLDLLTSSIPSSVIIEVDIHHGIQQVLVDSTQLHQALLNLATNAVHAMNRKGTLTVRSYAVNLTRAEHGRSGDIAAGEYAIIEVADTGCGMDAMVLSKAFEPFYTTKAAGEGTGMGLSVVLGIVQSHGGDIQVESEVGKGTTVRIFLPVTEEAISGSIDDNPHSSGAGAERILFVDDEEMLVEVNNDLLTSLGYTVTAVSNSLDALAILQEKGADIDVLITDHTMPGMTGIELSKKALAIRKDLPIILCTGFSNEINRESAEALGIRKFIMKPYRAYEISTAVREVLDAKKIST